MYQVSTLGRMGISFTNPGEQFGVDLGGVFQDDLVVPPVGGHTLDAVNPCRFEFPGQNNVDQNPATARMDTEKRTSVGQMERRRVLLQFTPVQIRDLVYERTINAGGNRVTINAFSCRASHPASIRQTDAALSFDQPIAGRRTHTRHTPDRGNSSSGPGNSRPAGPPIVDILKDPFEGTSLLARIGVHRKAGSSRAGQCRRACGSFHLLQDEASTSGGGRPGQAALASGLVAMVALPTRGVSMPIYRQANFVSTTKRCAPSRGCGWSLQCFGLAKLGCVYCPHFRLRIGSYECVRRLLCLAWTALLLCTPSWPVLGTA